MAMGSHANIDMTVERVITSAARFELDFVEIADRVAAKAAKLKLMRGASIPCIGCQNADRCRDGLGPDKCPKGVGSG